MNAQVEQTQLMNPVVGVFKTMRPKQWTKNLFVFAAALFTDALPVGQASTSHTHKLLVTTIAFMLFCLISGAVYLMNDIADRDRDREHPVKRNRPIASGAVPVSLAITCSVIFGLGGIALGWKLNPSFGSVCLVYYVMQIAYTLWLKHMVILDVFTIAAGFVLRAVGGAVVIHVNISMWLLVCTLQLALFLGFGKRRNELTSLAETASNHRKTLSFYSVSLLDQLIAITLAGTTMCYAMYTISSATAMAHPALVITLMNVLYGVFRYLYLIQIEHKGGSPETILLEDRPMQINLILWFVEVMLAFRFGRF